MFCHKCGNALLADALFCPKCGAKVPVAASMINVVDNVAPASPSPVGQEPGRGSLILILGILSLVCLGPLVGIPAWVMGSGDLKKINQGLIPQSERSGTKVGMILGIIGTFLVIFFVVLGIAVAVGITMFADNAINANRDALANDLGNLASRARQYYHRPAGLGGGGQSFDRLQSIILLTNKPESANGSYWIVRNVGGDGPVEIGAKGVEINDGSPVEVHVMVFPNHDSLWIIN